MSEKKKSAPLQSKQAVIKSAAKLPALKHKGEWVEFDAYVEAARRLDQLSDAVLNHEQGNPTWGLPSADGLQASYDEFERYWKMFERDELYRKRNKERWVKRPKDDNHPGGGYYTKTEITRRVVLEKIGLLVGSFPNATPHNMETYVGMLAEEIIAANPRVSVLEATFRELR